jgi:heme O synthase-like polyprenyltransferase
VTDIHDDFGAKRRPTVSMGSAGDYFELLKPRVMSLVILTALVGMVLSPEPLNPVIGFAALLAIAVGAGASGCLNMWWDADIDARMSRTSKRPIPAGSVTADEALAFGITLSVGSVLFLGVHHLLLCRDLFDVAEALDRTEHRDRRRSGCVPAHDWLCGSNRQRQSR